MNLRSLTLTVAVLAALCAAAWFMQRPDAPLARDARVGQPVLAADLATQAAQLRLTDAGKTVSLARQTDGSWRVTDYHDLPADFSKLSRLIDDLTGAKIQRLVTTRPDRLARLEFKDTTLILLDGTGKELWHLTLGKNADGGGRFLRYGTEEKGYEAGLSTWLDPDPKNWADPVVLNLKPEEIAGVELDFPDGSRVSASRPKKEAAWTAAAPAGKRLKAESITSLLGNLAPLRFSDTAAPDDANAVAARAHSRSVKLTTFGKKSFTIVLGRKPEEKKPRPAAPAAAPASAPPGAAPAPAKPVEPQFETIPAGPLFAFVTTDDASAPINGLMKKRAFEINEWAFTSLPATAANLWEDAPQPAATRAKPAPEKPVTPTPPLAAPAPKP